MTSQTAIKRSAAGIGPRRQTSRPAECSSTTRRERLILEHLPQVRLIARRIHDRLPASVSLEDLVSAGTLGLIAAIDHFDPSHNVKLQTYAEYKIRGAILDSLRGLDWAPRQKRRKAKRIESAAAAAEQRLQRQPTEEELARELGLTLEELHGWLIEVRAVNLGSLDFAREEGGSDLLRFLSDSEEKWPSRQLEQAELARLVEEAIRKIPEAERRVIRLYYKENLTLREIAAMVGLHESRISQIKTQAIARLRGYMGNRWPTGRGK